MNSDQNSCVGKMPCAKFMAAFGITAGSFVFGAVMLATGGVSAPLAPFYCGLITASVSYWCVPPNVASGNEQPTPQL